MPESPLISTSRNGSSASPTTSTNAATIRYRMLYRFMSCPSSSRLFSAAGLYMLKIIAEPMPSSARFNMPRISENSPFTPRYAAAR